MTDKDHNNVCHELEQIDPHVGKDTLGVLLAPSGNMLSELKYLGVKVRTWVDNAKKGYLPVHKIFASISTTILKTLQYPLLALSLTRKQCDQLVHPIYETALPKSHICREFPQGLLYASKDVLGLDFPDMYVLQGILKVDYFIKNFNALSSLKGPLLRTNMEWAQMEIGIGRNLFDLDYDTFGEILPDKWIKSLWQSNHEYQISIPSVSLLLDLHRENDVF